jgi:hypothetical protein
MLNPTEQLKSVILLVVFFNDTVKIIFDNLRHLADKSAFQISPGTRIKLNLNTLVRTPLPATLKLIRSPV